MRIKKCRRPKVPKWALWLSGNVRDFVLSARWFLRQRTAANTDRLCKYLARKELRTLKVSGTKKPAPKNRQKTVGTLNPGSDDAFLAGDVGLADNLAYRLYAR